MSFFSLSKQRHTSRKGLLIEDSCTYRTRYPHSRLTSSLSRWCILREWNMMLDGRDDHVCYCRKAKASNKCKDLFSFFPIFPTTALLYTLLNPGSSFTSAYIPTVQCIWHASNKEQSAYPVQLEIPFQSSFKKEILRKCGLFQHNQMPSGVIFPRQLLMPFPVSLLIDNSPLLLYSV